MTNFLLTLLLIKLSLLYFIHSTNTSTQRIIFLENLFTWIEQIWVKAFFKNLQFFLHQAHLSLLYYIYIVGLNKNVHANLSPRHTCRITMQENTKIVYTDIHNFSCLQFLNNNRSHSPQLDTTAQGLLLLTAIEPIAACIYIYETNSFKKGRSSWSSRARSSCSSSIGR